MSNTTTANGTVAATPDEYKNIWEQIKEFFDDKNNFAMFLVLPLIVLVYGGCAVVYCVYKCRRQCKSSQKKKQKQIERKQRKHSIVTQNQMATLSERCESRPRTPASIAAEVRDEQTTPLPWQIQDDKQNEKVRKKEETSNAKTPPPPYREVDEVEETIVLSGPQRPAYPVNKVSNSKKTVSTLELTKELLRIDENKDYGRRRRVVFVTEQ